MKDSMTKQQSPESQTSKTVVFDIETNGLLLECDKFWVGWTYCIETKKWERFTDVRALVDFLNDCDSILGHNIIGYDIPVLNKLSPVKIREDIKIIDTLILGRLAYYDQDRSFSHSLDAYRQRS